MDYAAAHKRAARLYIEAQRLTDSQRHPGPMTLMQCIFQALADQEVAEEKWHQESRKVADSALDDARSYGDSD